MKQFFSKSSLLRGVLSLVFCLTMVGSAFAANGDKTTVTFKNWTKGVTAYSSTAWTDLGCTFTYASNNSKGWDYVRCGGKGGSASSDEKTATSTIAYNTKFEVPVKSVVLNNSGISSTSFTINSITVTAYSDEAFSESVGSATITDSYVQSGCPTSFTLTPETQFPADSYIKVAINWTAKGTKNCGLNLTSIDYVEGLSDAELSKTATTVTFGEGAQTAYTVYMGDAFTAPTATVTGGEGLAATYASTNESVATVDASTGAVSIVGVGTTTISASFAGDDTYASSTASYDLTVKAALTTYTSIATALAAATSTAAEAKYAFDGNVVTAVSAKNVYIQDASGKGAQIYAADHGFTVGQTITGTVPCSIQLYNSMLEFTNITAATPGLTLGTGTPVAVETAAADLGESTSGAFVKVANLVYDGTNKVFKCGEVSVTPYATFMTLPTFENGHTYTVTGVFIYFKKSGSYVLELCPRYATDIEDTTPAAKENATLTFTAKEKMNVGDAADEYTVSYDGDGTLAVSSSDVTVAEVSLDGTTVTVTAKAAGTSTITISAAETENYYEVKKTYTLKVVAPVDASSFKALVSSYNGNYYAMSTTVENKAFKGVAVNVVNNKVVAAADKDAIAWALVDGTIVNTNDEQVSCNNADVSLVEESSTEYTEKTDSKGTYWVSGTRSFVYRDSSKAFKNYAVSNAGNSGYGTVAYVMPFVDGYVRESLTDGNFGTICMPNAVSTTDYAGATFYSIAGVVKSGDDITGIALVAEEGDLVAGKPYIFKASAATLVAAYTGEAVADAVEATGLVGNLTTDPVTVADGNYVLTNNTLRKVNGGTATVAANRAYIDLTGVAEYTSSAKVVVLDIEGMATAINGVSTSAQDAVIYNLAGQRVAGATKGLYIINGKKVIK